MIAPVLQRRNFLGQLLNLGHPITLLLLLRHLESHAHFTKRPYLSGPATDLPKKESEIERMDLCEGVADEIGGLAPLAPHAREKSEQGIGCDLFEVEAQRTGTTRK